MPASLAPIFRLGMFRLVSGMAAVIAAGATVAACILRRRRKTPVELNQERWNKAVR